MVSHQRAKRSLNILVVNAFLTLVRHTGNSIPLKMKTPEDIKRHFEGPQNYVRVKQLTWLSSSCFQHFKYNFNCITIMPCMYMYIVRTKLLAQNKQRWFRRQWHQGWWIHIHCTCTSQQLHSLSGFSTTVRFRTFWLMSFLHSPYMFVGWGKSNIPGWKTGEPLARVCDWKPWHMWAQTFDNNYSALSSLRDCIQGVSTNTLPRPTLS